MIYFHDCDSYLTVFLHVIEKSVLHFITIEMATGLRGMSQKLRDMVSMDPM